MRIAVLIKQIPAPEQLQFDDGRVVRDGVDLEVNAYCRRANAKAVDLAGPGGETVVFTMGPPEADEALREMIACGASRGVHLCDEAFAGSDTLATARVLAAAIAAEGTFDLVLAGLNSLDADTGQVPVQVAELLGLEIAAGVRELEIVGTTFNAKLETDSGHRSVAGVLPVVMSTAERLCSPSKAGPELCDEVPAARIMRVTADELGIDVGLCGQAGSPTSVGAARSIEPLRSPRIARSCDEAVEMLRSLGAFERDRVAPEPVSNPSGTSGKEVWCAFDDHAVGAELLGEAAELAATVGGSVCAFVRHPVPKGLGSLGADRVIEVSDGAETSEFASALGAAAAGAEPWALLVEGTRTGRVVAATVAARCGWGLTGDAIALEVDSSGSMVAWKPAFGGRLEAPIYTNSAVQMATIRPGVLALRAPRATADPPVETVVAPTRSAIRTTALEEEPDSDLRRADVVVAVGQGVEPSGYDLVDELRTALGGAAVGSTRKVTDKAWLPRATQIGVTGHSISPRLLVSIGASGRFNYTVGIRNAGSILAIDKNPDAEIFGQVDVGLVGDWREIVPALCAALAR